MARVKRVLGWLLIAFAVYAIITSPEQAASIVRTVWDIILEAFKAIGSFFDALLGRSQA